MPLTLVTGPANSAKAQAVLDGYVAALPREPLLVVPRAADAEHYRRELAERGIVFGVRVERFAGLLRELARRAAVHERVLGAHARHRVVEAAIAATRLEVLAASAATPGFAAACVELIAELEARRVEPARLRTALRGWSAAGGPRRQWGEEVAALYGAYRERLERLGVLDDELAAWRALDALRLDPRAWGATPVFLYGFDDLDELQRDAVETLAVSVGAPVTLSLPYEPGRVAFAGRARTFEELRPLADEHVLLEAADGYYESAARARLHALERGLFEGKGGAPAQSDAAVTLLEAPSQQAEYDQVARTVAALLEDEGFAPADVAIVTRASGADAAQLARCLAHHGVPFAPFLRTRFADTAGGRGLLALLRCAVLDGSAEDLVAYLRTPGVLDHPDLVDDLEARLRRGGVTGAGDALALWEELRFPLDAIARLRAARGRGMALVELLAGELERLFAAPWERRAALLDEAWQAQALAVGAARRALEELRALALAEPRLAPSAAEIHAALERVQAGPAPGEGVQVCDPLALRARRVRALVLCGLQAGSFPRGESAHPFFGGEERRALARASGLLLSVPEDVLNAERYLLYATVSRPTARLVLSWRTAGDDGEPAQRSLFVDDVLDCLGEAAPVVRVDAERAAGAGHRALRVVPLAPEVLGERPLSPSSLERWSDCPVAWLVERELRLSPLEPDAEPLARGSLAHAALERVLSGVRELSGSARLDDPERLAQARRLLDVVLAELAEERPISADELRARIEQRRLHADLERYLEHAAGWGSRLEPTFFELDFGLEGSAHPAVELADGELRLRGRIDRVDVDVHSADGTCVVVDYKSSRATPAARWIADRRFQLALYMLVVERLLGVAVAGGFYQALRGRLDTRGALRADVDPDARCVTGDRLAPQELAELLSGALELALTAARELRGGQLEPRPHSCGPGGCAFPAICRARA